MTQLPDVREIVAFEAACQQEPPWYRERRIRAVWGVSSARYHQVLNGLLDLPAIVVVEPQLVRRLWRLRDQRRVKRTARRVA